MMRIHTTQNLMALGTTIQPTNVVSQKDFRLKISEFSEQSGTLNSSYKNEPAFGKKGDIRKISRFFNKKKGQLRQDAIMRHKKLVGDMKNGKDTFSTKPTLADKILDVMGHEVVVQAAISCIVCTCLRPAAIMALPNKKDKRDNMYAAAHSISSGILGLLTAFLISFPFSRGVNSFNKKYIKELSLPVLKEMFPDLSTKSLLDESKLKDTTAKIIKDANNIKFKDGKSLNEVLNGESLENVVNKIVNEGAVDDKSLWSTKDGKKLAEVINGNLREIMLDTNAWKFNDGKRFIPSTASAQMMPATIQISEILNPKTFEHYGIQANVEDIDKYMKEHNNSLVGMKVMTKEGEKSLFDALPVQDMTIGIENLGDDFYKNLGYDDVTFYPVYHLDRDFLAKTVSETDNKVLKQLDVNTAFDINGKLKHPKDWLDKTGKQIEDYESLVDYLGISTYYEATRVMPIHTGAEREAGKLASYLDNPTVNTNYSGIPSELGTKITKESIIADKYNTTKQKNVTWLPDIVTRIPMATLTVALIPFVLKKAFNLEKTSTKPQNQQTVTEQINTNADVQTGVKPSFKSKGEGLFGKFLGKKFTVWLYNQKWFDKMSKSMVDSKLPGDMTANLQTLGSCITSGTYVARTAKNKDLDPEKRRTLTINQIINFIIPTIFAYTVSKLLGGWVSDKQKNYSANYSRRANMGLATGRISKQEFDDFMAKKGTRLKGVKVLASLVTFTLIYRFLTPVLMTPIANNIGEKFNARKKQKDIEKTKLANA